MDTPAPPPTRLDHLCPICGQPNACAMAAKDGSQQPCWCVNATFSSDVLALVPAEARGLRCVCATCAARPPQAAQP